MVGGSDVARETRVTRKCIGVSPYRDYKRIESASREKLRGKFRSRTLADQNRLFLFLFACFYDLDKHTSHYSGNIL